MGLKGRTNRVGIVGGREEFVPKDAAGGGVILFQRETSASRIAIQPKMGQGTMYG